MRVELGRASEEEEEEGVEIRDFFVLVSFLILFLSFLLVDFPFPFGLYG